MKPCPSCDRHIRTTEKECPHCGNDLRSALIKWRNAAAAGAASMVLAACYGGAGTYDSGELYDSVDDTSLIDNDSDGHFASEDCNDEDASINPDADEVCDDEVDNDCDDLIDGDDDECV
jgi:hypothetical protein